MEDRGFRVGGHDEEGGARGDGKETTTSFSFAGGMPPLYSICKKCTKFRC